MDEDENRIEEIESRFELSRASLVTQLFIALATVNGGGFIAVFAMLGQGKIVNIFSYYLIFASAVLGFGIIFILSSAFYRFQHSVAAEEVKKAEIKNEDENEKILEENRLPLNRKYKGLMWASLTSSLFAILLGIVGAIHSFSVSGGIYLQKEPNNRVKSDRELQSHRSVVRVYRESVAILAQPAQPQGKGLV